MRRDGGLRRRRRIEKHPEPGNPATLEFGRIGPGDGENGNRIMSADKPLFFDASGTELMPCLCKAWEVSADGRIHPAKAAGGC